jgi:rare lipoprotein A (peptidoglycan hydrolase)
MYAAVAAFSYYATPFRVKVCRTDDPNRCVIVTVRDECAGLCRKHLKQPWNSKSRAIDLSPTAFSRLADLGRGVLAVTITEVLRDRR